MIMKSFTLSLRLKSPCERARHELVMRAPELVQEMSRQSALTPPESDSQGLAYGLA